jgi:hypothetical protein
MPSDSTVTTPPVNPPTTPPAGTNPPAGGSGQPPDLDALFKTLTTALSEMDSALQPFDITMSTEEMRRLIYIEKGRDGYLEAGNLHNSEDGANYLSPRKTVTLSRAFRIWKGLEPVTQRIDQIRQRTRILQVAAGSQAYYATSELEKSTFAEGRQGDLKAREIAADDATRVSGYVYLSNRQTTRRGVPGGQAALHGAEEARNGGGRDVGRGYPDHAEGGRWRANHANDAGGGAADG